MPHAQRYNKPASIQTPREHILIWIYSLMFSKTEWGMAQKLIYGLFVKRTDIPLAQAIAEAYLMNVGMFWLFTRSTSFLIGS